MTAVEYSQVQIMAARIRMKADEKLKRETPASIEAIAKSEPLTASPTKSSATTTGRRLARRS